MVYNTVLTAEKRGPQIVGVQIAGGLLYNVEIVDSSLIAYFWASVIFLSF